MIKGIAVSLVASLALNAADARAQTAASQWFVRSDIQGVWTRFTDAAERDTLGSLGVFVHADYLERAGFTFGYSGADLSFMDSSQDIAQDNLYASGRWHLNPDWASGRVTLRMDAHAISNDDRSSGVDEVDVIAGQVSYLNFAKTLYLDVGLTQSRYGGQGMNAPGLDVDQVTPTLGFGFNEQYDWLQLRAYLIDLSSREQAQNQDSTTAVELKWTHWFQNRALLGLDNVRVSALAGERLFAVDPDTAAVYNLADLQTGGVAIGGEWALSERSRILVVAGAERYENQVRSDFYDASFIALNIAHDWN
jgi:hypothetical protein